MTNLSKANAANSFVSVVTTTAFEIATDNVSG